MVLGVEAKNVLELGAGFSTKTILEALKHTGGKLTTLDQREIEQTGNGADMLQKFPNWKFVKGHSVKNLGEMSHEPYDLVLHDGSHEWRDVYRDLKKIIPHIKRNGILLVHDTLHKPTFRLLMATKLALLFTRHEIVTLPYGYGLSVIKILGNAKNGDIVTTWQKSK